MSGLERGWRRMECETLKGIRLASQPASRGGMLASFLYISYGSQMPFNYYDCRSQCRRQSYKRGDQCYKGWPMWKRLLVCVCPACSSCGDNRGCGMSPHYSCARITCGSDVTWIRVPLIEPFDNESGWFPHPKLTLVGTGFFWRFC